MGVLFVRVQFVLNVLCPGVRCPYPSVVCCVVIIVTSPYEQSAVDDVEDNGWRSGAQQDKHFGTLFTLLFRVWPANRLVVYQSTSAQPNDYTDRLFRKCRHLGIGSEDD